jgi:heterotetrameric sarcosine oxidase gamma subunit
MLEHRTPLVQVSRAQELSTIDVPGLRVAAVESRGYLLLQGNPEDPLLQKALREQIGVEAPGPQLASMGSEYSLLWTAPGQWLLESPVGRVSTVQAALAARLGAALAAVTDLSDAFGCLEVSGEAAADVLMTGCSLDLQPRAFTAGRVARTAVAAVPVILWRPGDPHRFRCLVDRSLAEHFWSWLVQAPR